VGVGTGQGLNLAYNIIVEKHKGKLFFDSTVGVGTTFHIQLPINQTIL
jgi:signal transduction histidine kinase